MSLSQILLACFLLLFGAVTGFPIRSDFSTYLLAGLAIACALAMFFHRPKA